MPAIEYLKHPAAQGLFDCALLYKKKETTALRLPAANEIGQSFTTFKASPADPRGYTQESASVISADVIMARNSNTVLGKDDAGNPVYNEWPIPRATAEKNYGIEIISGLGAEFQEHRKKATLRAVELTETLAQSFGFGPGEAFEIKVSWSDQPMLAHVGDYLTDQGYSVAKKNMEDYVLAVGPDAAPCAPASTPAPKA